LIVIGKTMSNDDDNALDLNRLRRRQQVADALARYKNEVIANAANNRGRSNSLLFLCIGLFSGTIIGFFSCAAAILVAFIVRGKSTSWWPFNDTPQRLNTTTVENVDRAVQCEPSSTVATEIETSAPVPIEQSEQQAPEVAQPEQIAEPVKEEPIKEEHIQESRVQVVPPPKKAPKKKPWEKK
jgi:hypothetical protein